jgi:hypothetical protein
MIKSKHNIFEISDNTITFYLCYLIGKDYHLRHKEFIVDIFSKYYKNQVIKFIAADGENLYFSGFLEFVKQLQEMFDIPNNNIEFHTVTGAQPGYTHRQIDYSIFKNTGRHLVDTSDRVTDNLQTAKFVGVFNSSRVTLNRLLMSYEIGIAFPNDYYMTQHPDVEDTLRYLKDFDDLYAKEIAWFRQKEFLEPDLQYRWPNSRILNWEAVANNYRKTKKLYAIEVVMETDEFYNRWLTEKSAKVLASGKPFVMLAGKSSLRVLQEFGFKTFGDIIDESYDQASDPYGRIQGIIKSLSELYFSADKNEKILKMYKIAEYNKQAYIKFKHSFQ